MENETRGIDTSAGVKRVFYIDNIRLYLTVLVILHHLSVGYGGSGGWFIKESSFHAIDTFTVVLLTIFTAINQSYFMAFFFLLAGYFTPRSYDRKGSILFLKDRFIRLGIPVLIYVVFFAPLVDFILINFAYGGKASYIDLMVNQIVQVDFQFGHLWFLLALLIFALIYSLYRSIADRHNAKQRNNQFLDSFPANKVIFLSIGVLAVITFTVRLNFLIGDVVLFNFQLAHFTHYAFCFWIGILAYRGKWFEKLSKSQARIWIGVTLLTISLLPLIMLLLVDFASSDPFGPFLGGMTFQSLVYSTWESVALLSITISLLYIFQNKFNRQNRLLKELASSAYTAYIIHALVVISIMIVLLPFTLPAMVKFVLASLIGVPMIFGTSYLIRKIPFADRVLG